MQTIHDGPADGHANMVRDSNLLETVKNELILRTYSWFGSWASYGYFQKKEQVVEYFSRQTISLVKRPTGGGIVDHRNDFTYTLFIPKAHPLHQLSRSSCYETIHQAVAKALQRQNIPAVVITEEQGNDLTCFTHPVPGDLLDPQSGSKIAGAAQRRTRKGILHQGSILAPKLDPQLFGAAFRKSLEALPSA